jgi:predicted outer membrane repeat protein
MSALRPLSHSAIRRLCSVLLLLALAAAYVPMAVPSAAAVTPTTYWVDDGGSDGNPGTEAEPFKTITNAASVALSDDTIMVKPGLYDAANGETFPISLWGESLVSSDGTATTILDGGSTSLILSVHGDLDGLEIRGLTFRNGGGCGPGAGMRVYASYGTSQTDSPLIEGNYFQSNEATGYAGGALNIYSSGPDPLRPRIADNVFVGNSSAQQGGALQTDGRVSPTLVSNVFIGNTRTTRRAALRLSSGQTGLIETTFSKATRLAWGRALELTLRRQRSRS